MSEGKWVFEVRDMNKEFHGFPFDHDDDHTSHPGRGMFSTWRKRHVVRSQLTNNEVVYFTTVWELTYPERDGSDTVVKRISKEDMSVLKLKGKA